MDEKSLEETVTQLQAKVNALERGRHSSRRWLVVGLGVLVTAGLALAQPVPNVFAPDTPARADQVNVNFADLVTRLGALTTRVATLETTNVPAGTIAFFELTICPNGWTPYDPARGRTIVGLPSTFAADGGLGGTQGGTPLSDRENRSHGHQWSRFDGPNLDWYSYNSLGVEEVVINWTDGMDSAGSGDYPLELGAATSRGLYTDRQSSLMPYLQLLACKKN